MFTYSVEEWLLLFYIYCFFGWCFESTYVSLRTGHWVNRGFMRSPFLPLYGSGAILLLVVSRPFVNNIFLTYIAGCIAATLLELLTGMAMEKLFKIKYWNYSNQRFNYKGHICLSSSIAWGFMTLLVTKVIHAPIASFVIGLPEVVKDASVLMLTVVLTWDFALSFRAALDLRDLLIKLEEAKAELEELREEIEDRLEHIQAELTANFEVRISKLHELIEESNLESLDEIKEDYKQWRKRFYENQHKRIQALNIKDKFKLHHLLHNPTMSSEKFKDAMDEVRKHILELQDSEKKDKK